MSEFYKFISTEPSPLLLDDAKAYMKVSSTDDDDLIKSMINAVTDYAEHYTGRTFRVQTWQLLLDAFADDIPICKNVMSITHIKYLVSTIQQTIAAATYYLKQEQQGARILLAEDQEWPGDLDDIQQGIEIEFKTSVYGRNPYEVINGMKRHLLYLYENRGDCDAEDAAKKSGADKIYDMYRIVRV